MSILSFFMWCFVYIVCAIPYAKYILDSKSFNLQVSEGVRGLIIVIGFVLLSLVGGEVQDAWDALPFHTWEG